MSTRDPPEHATEVLLDFFVVFSQFEYALKRAGYVKAASEGSGAGPSSPHGRRPAVDWRAFRLAIRRRRNFRRSSSPELEDAVEYLLRYPPMEQRLAPDGRTIEWRELGVSDNDGELWRLLRIVRAVRNNLFHGGKYPHVAVDEVARNSALLEHAMTVVNALVACDDQVARFYGEAERTWTEMVEPPMSR